MIYLDSAATALLKPPEVGEAMLRAMRSCASPGRGIHDPAMRAADLLLACREEAAALFGVPNAENVVFTMNATHGLNIAINSLVRAGTKVLVSGYEHNAVMRPLFARRAVLETAHAPLFDTAGLLSAFRERIPAAEVVVCTHVSNVFGYRLPLEEIAALCRADGVPLIVDAAQSAGVLDIDFDALGAAFLAMPGHKGLMGPQGTGLLLCRDGSIPLLCGGTGTLSRDRTMPEDLPERLEAGTQNVCGIAGLLAAIRYVRKRGVSSIRRREERLIRRLIDDLSDREELQLFLPPRDRQTGVLSVLPRGMDAEALAAALGKQGVAVRAGLQCAPQAHETAGTIDTGTVRFSVSAFNTPPQIDEAAAITKNILKNRYKM